MHKMKRTKGARRQNGAVLAEYGLIVAGVVMVSLVAVGIFGSKVGGLIGSAATLLPSASTQQNAPIQVGQLIETRTADANGDGVREIVMDVSRIVDEKGGLDGQDPAVPRLGEALGGLDAHDTSHLIQIGSQENLFHAN